VEASPAQLHVLAIKGERKETTDEAEKAFSLHERLERHFDRRFELPRPPRRRS
jgi:HSP20 family molecular chaperone IbpA